MSWIWPNYIDSMLELTKAERRAVHRDAWKHWWKDKRNIALYLMLPGIYLPTVFFAADMGGKLAVLIGPGGFVHKLFRAAGLFVLFVVCFAVGGAVLQRYRFAPCVYRALRQRGHDVCATCGYCLRGLERSFEKCPECGADRTAMTTYAATAVQQAR